MGKAIALSMFLNSLPVLCALAGGTAVAESLPASRTVCFLDAGPVHRRGESPAEEGRRSVGGSSPLLVKPMAELCFGCHRALGERIKGSAFLHEPVRSGYCTACHDPHGSDFTMLLKKISRPSEWDPYPDPLRTLCLDCHEKAVFLSETANFTGFRNGDLNLHFVHVNRKKGRKCGSCHDAHASDQPMHVRPDVPFGRGGWKLPLAFTRTGSGGSCVVGCHREQGYDRLNPVVNPR